MYLMDKINEIASTITDSELDGYLSNYLTYKDIKDLFNSDKLGSSSISSSIRLEIFFVMNEDIPLTKIGETAGIGLSYLGGNGIQLYERRGTKYFPIAFSNDKVASSYVFIDNAYVSPAIFFGIDYIEGVLPPKTKKISKLYNIRTAVALSKRPSYKNIENLNDEIEKILYSISPKETAIHFEEVSGQLKLYNGQTEIPNVSSVEYDLDGNLISYTVSSTKTDVSYSNSQFVDFIQDISNGDYAFEFMNVNGRAANMISSDRVVIYSALLNFTKSQLDGTKSYLNYLKTIYGNQILYNNWDRFRILFTDFLNQISKRTIHY